MSREFWKFIYITSTHEKSERTNISTVFIFCYNIFDLLFIEAIKYKLIYKVTQVFYNYT
jgi:hypothetical protein